MERWEGPWKGIVEMDARADCLLGRRFDRVFEDWASQLWNPFDMAETLTLTGGTVHERPREVP